jgi:hypothetical protein
MMSWLLDLGYLVGVAGMVLGARWLMAMSTPTKDWQLAQRVTEQAKTSLRRVASRARVWLYVESGYTKLCWLAMRHKWQKLAASE